MLGRLIQTNHKYASMKLKKPCQFYECRLFTDISLQLKNYQGINAKNEEKLVIRFYSLQNRKRDLYKELYIQIWVRQQRCFFIQIIKLTHYKIINFTPETTNNFNFNIERINISKKEHIKKSSGLHSKGKGGGGWQLKKGKIRFK